MTLIESFLKDFCGYCSARVGILLSKGTLDAVSVRQLTQLNTGALDEIVVAQRGEMLNRSVQLLQSSYKAELTALAQILRNATRATPAESELIVATMENLIREYGDHEEILQLCSGIRNVHTCV